MMEYSFHSSSLKSSVMMNLVAALEYINKAYTLIDKALKEEKKLSYQERNQLFNYGLSDVNIHKVRLANVKKAILSITGNKKFRDLKEVDHAESLA